MEVLLDNKTLSPINLHGHNLEEILGEIMNLHVPEDRIINEVLLNGRMYSEQVPREAAGVDRDEIGILEVQTIPSVDLAHALVKTGPGYMDTLIQAAGMVAEQFRIGDEAEANEQLSTFVQTLQDLFSMVDQALEILAIPLDRFESDGVSARAKIKELNQLLQEMISRQEDRDWILLADLLEYELADLLGDWKKILAQVGKMAN